MTTTVAIQAQPASAKLLQSAADDLLAWYDKEGRALPWRAAVGEPSDPYRVWLSEVMLQQTTVKAVIPYFGRFLAHWPTLEDLARADREDVLRAWAGLGYYSRARNLHACANTICSEYGGRFPDDPAELRRLPGIGPYTAAAIAAIAFDRPVTPMDGNVERVVSRLFALEVPLPGAKPELNRLAQSLTPRRRPGDFAQALMDLGAGICTPKRPSCLICPLKSCCRANARGLAATLPLRAGRAERPVRRGTAFVVIREDGYVLLRQRPEEGLLAAMMEVPSTDWGEAFEPTEQALRTAPVRADWWRVTGEVTHTFTHFRLELLVFLALVPCEVTLTLWADQNRCRWVHRRKLDGEALPSVMRKVISHAFNSDRE